ncbi:uncharacterized protein [Amphiura filiformis]|uniref:uncharacterized protein n=1 Tax=Amphiura filiformis TaxID=82378 RepID=UPI003B20C18C
MAAHSRKQKMKKRVEEETIDSDDSYEDSSEEITEDSDVELQKAFERKEIKAGLNYEANAPKTHINNEEELKDKLSDIRLNLDWIERLDVTCDGNKRLIGQEEDPDEVHDDFRREMGFYRQAQHAVLEALPKLHEMGMSTKRPEDYFAEMAKSDQHMRKVREKLIAKQLSLEKSEKAKKLRELRKFGKKVQHEVLLQRSKEKKELMESVKQFKKGNKESLDALLEGKKKGGGKKGGDVAKRKGQQQKDLKRRGPGKKRQYKDSKWGMGGKTDKRNNAKADDGAKGDGFNYKRNHSDVFKAKGKGKPMSKKGGKKGKQPMQRPGKNKRRKGKLSSRRK